MTTICPECGSDRVSERHIGRKTGGIVGVLLGRFVAGATAGAEFAARWRNGKCEDKQTDITN